MFMFHSDQLAPIRYTNLDFQSYMDSHWSTFNFVFTLGGATVIQKSVKQSCIVNSTKEAKYIATFEVEKKIHLAQKVPYGTWGSSLAYSAHDTIL